jgi:hypothetical protein
MKTLETLIHRARLCFISSTVLFVLFCLLGGGSWASRLSPWISESLRLGGYLCGIFSWSLMCTAYDLRRKAF